MVIPVRLRGPIAHYIGWAKGFIGLVRRLREYKNIQIEVLPVANYIPEDIDEDIRQMIVPVPRLKQMGILFGKPDRIATLGTNYKISYAMYETTDVPRMWKTDIGNFDEIWVPNQFCVELFRKYNPHVKVVPWGYDETLYNRRGKKEKKGYFEFGSVGVMSRRKGVDVLVRAFSMAFPDQTDVFLTIKTRNTKWMPKIEDNRIAVIDEDWSDDELADFYHRLDCLVQSHRGEGVCMPPLEAAACGTPVIVTNWSGPTDYIDNCGIYGLNISGLTASDGMESGRATNWAEPDVNHLVDLMRFMYEDTPVVKGNYTKHSFDVMAKEFASAISLAWGRANR